MALFWCFYFQLVTHLAKKFTLQSSAFIYNCGWFTYAGITDFFQS